MKNFWAFILGSLFAVGLMLSGMANSEKVLGFLDLFGTWDPSLAFVMGGAILIAFVPFQKIMRRTEPKTLYGEKIMLPDVHRIDSKLLAGATLFGIGWGIAGICPAPALTLIGLGHFEAFYFIAAMLAGMWMHRKLFG